MSPSLAFLTIALGLQLLFLLRLMRSPQEGPALFWPLAALLAAAAVLVYALHRRDYVLFCGQLGVAILYALHLLQRRRRRHE